MSYIFRQCCGKKYFLILGIPLRGLNSGNMPYWPSSSECSCLRWHQSVWVNICQEEEAGLDSPGLRSGYTLDIRYRIIRYILSHILSLILLGYPVSSCTGSHWKWCRTPCSTWALWAGRLNNLYWKYPYKVYINSYLYHKSSISQAVHYLEKIRLVYLSPLKWWLGQEISHVPIRGNKSSILRERLTIPS